MDESIDISSLIDLLADNHEVVVNLLSVQICLVSVLIGVLLAIALWRFLK